MYGTGTQGTQGHGMWVITAKVGGKCDISFYVKMCYLWSTLDSIFQSHLGHLTMFTQKMRTCVKFTFADKIEAMYEGRT